MDVIFTWVLIVGLVHKDPTIIYKVRIPMVDEATCLAAEKSVEVRRKLDGHKDPMGFLGVVCERSS